MPRSHRSGNGWRERHLARRGLQQNSRTKCCRCGIGARQTAESGRGQPRLSPRVTAPQHLRALKCPGKRHLARNTGQQGRCGIPRAGEIRRPLDPAIGCLAKPDDDLPEHPPVVPLSPVLRRSAVPCGIAAYFVAQYWPDEREPGAVDCRPIRRTVSDGDTDTSGHQRVGAACRR